MENFNIAIQQKEIVWTNYILHIPAEDYDSAKNTIKEVISDQKNPFELYDSTSMKTYETIIQEDDFWVCDQESIINANPTRLIEIIIEGDPTLFLTNADKDAIKKAIYLANKKCEETEEFDSFIKDIKSYLNSNLFYFEASENLESFNGDDYTEPLS